MEYLQSRALSRCRNIADLRDLCRRRLPAPLFHFIDGGAEDEWTLRQNTQAFQRHRLAPRALVDVRNVATEVTVLGRRIALPIILAPTGGARNIHRQAEPAAARAAARAGAYYTLSNFSSTRLESVAVASDGPKMFQLYPVEDKGLTSGMIRRAKAAGYTALCITIDSPVGGARERDQRNGLMLAKSGLLCSLPMVAGAIAHPAWLWNYLLEKPDSYCNFDDERGLEPPERQAHGRTQSQSVTWDYVASLVDEWGGPFAIKGILSGDDANRAASIGATAVIVSNHGGRQLDGAVATIEVLPRVVDAVAGRIEVILDGGVRRGSHVLKALALGARACMIGRPHAYGLGAAGEAGVSRALDILRAEIERTMKLLGCADVAMLDRSYLAPEP